jgi:hypothetical protein
MADTDSPLKATITDLATAPSNESVDGQSVTERPLSELIEADKHLGGNAALQKTRFGMVTRKIRRGGALG